MAKKKQKKGEVFEPVVRTVTQPQLESYLYGFLASRGFDLYPRVKETKDGWLIALYYDRQDKGWWRVFQLELDGKDRPEVLWFALGIALVNHLMNSGVPPRSPAPLGEPNMKMLRNMILGQLQDGIDAQIAIKLLNNVSGTFTAHLRPRDMAFDFGDEQPYVETKGGEEDSADPSLEEELDALEKAIEEAKEEEDDDNVLDLPQVAEPNDEHDDAGEGISF